jgi:phage I-like protein
MQNMRKLVATSLAAALACTVGAIEYNSSSGSEHLQRAVELNFKQGEKILISPIGTVTGLDGRVFNIDGETVIRNTKENGIDLVFDINHGWDSAYGDKAAGWISLNSLELREDGIYGSVELTDLGKELIENKYYKYTSPAYNMDRNKADRNVLSLDSLGLVNRPNLNNKALNNQDDGSGDKIKKLNEKIETLLTEKNQAIQTAEATANELDEANKKIESYDPEKIKELNTTIRDLTIDLGVERNQIIPKDREFCKTLDEAQLASYIDSNGSQDLMRELNKKIEPKEKNKKNSRVATAVAAGSKK